MSDPKFVQRMVPFEVTRAGDDGLTLEGYAAVWDKPTMIDSWEGRFAERIAKGAFKKTISERTPVLQFDHGSHPLIGSIPLGSITQLREDDRGLFVRARLSDNWLVEPVRMAIRDGSIDGMSIRFRVVRDEWDHEQDVPLRSIGEAELFELGPVVWPAYEETSVGVRAREIATALTDPDQRAEIARALLVGTSAEPAEPGTSDEPAVDGPPFDGTRLSHHLQQQERRWNERMRSAA